MSVKLEAPVYKTEVVKVSNMEAVDVLNDDSLFLVIQDGFAHKISAKTLRESVYSAAQKQLDEFFKRYLKKQREAKEEFAQLSSDCLNTTESLGKTLQRKNQAKNKENLQYFETALADLSSSIDLWKDDLTKSITAEITANVEKTNSYIDSQLNLMTKALSSSFEDDVLKTYTSLSAEVTTEKTAIIENIETTEKTLQKQIDSCKKSIKDEAEAVSVESKKNLVEIAEKLNSLSSTIDDFDKKLYGLTVEEISDDFSVVNHTILTGDVNSLSSEISKLNQKYDSLLSAVDELKSLITK